MLKLFRRAIAPIAPKSPAVVPSLCAILEKNNLKTAEWHAFRSQQLEAAGDPFEAREHLKDAGEFLAQHGGPHRPKSAEEIYQWCAARRALET